MIEDSLARAAELRERGQLEEAASVLDAAARQDRDRVLPILKEVLESLQATEHGITFRHIPGGAFIMGSADGDADEAPLSPPVFRGPTITGITGTQGPGR